MAKTGDQDPTEVGGDAAVEAAARSVEQTVSATGEQETEVRRPIPPLLTDVDAPAPPVEAAGAGASADASKDRVKGETAADGLQPEVQKSAARPTSGGAGGKASEGAARAKQTSSKARRRLSAAASEAKDRASSAASDARERASNTDVKEFAHSTTSLIDTARPFFLAGCAALFAVLGFLEGDAGTAQVFAIGALIFVIGAAFSGEINAFLASRSHGRDRSAGRSDDD